MDSLAKAGACHMDEQNSCTFRLCSLLPPLAPQPGDSQHRNIGSHPPTRPRCQSTAGEAPPPPLCLFPRSPQSAVRSAPPRSRPVQLTTNAGLQRNERRLFICLGVGPTPSAYWPCCCWKFAPAVSLFRLYCIKTTEAERATATMGTKLNQYFQD
jgi:hypothetical protein